MLNSWEKFHSMKSMENWIGEVHFIPFLSITGCSVFVLSEAQPVFIGVPWQGSILGLVLFIIHFNVHIVLQFSKVSNFCHICQCIIIIHTLLYALLSHKMHGMGCSRCFCVPYCLVSNQVGLVTSWFIMVMIGPILNRIQLYLKTWKFVRDVCECCWFQCALSDYMGFMLF